MGRNKTSLKPATFALILLSLVSLCKSHSQERQDLLSDTGTRQCISSQTNKLVKHVDNSNDRPSVNIPKIKRAPINRKGGDNQVYRKMCKDYDKQATGEEIQMARKYIKDAQLLYIEWVNNSCCTAQKTLFNI